MTDEPNNMTVRQEYKKAALQGLTAKHDPDTMDFGLYAGDIADQCLAEDAAHDAKVKP